MKRQIITDVVQQMLPHLDNAQLKQLQKVLECTLFGCDITKQEEKETTNDNPKLIDSFISAKRIEGCSEKTLKYYRTTIETMELAIDKSIRHIQTEDLRSYLTGYQSKNQSSRVTIDNIRRILSSFFSWLEDEDYILKSPVRRIHKVKTATNIKETYTDEELEKMRDNCTELRDLAIIDMLASTGMRIGEMVLLNKADINFNERECVVFGKGDKERIVPVVGPVAALVRRMHSSAEFPHEVGLFLSYPPEDVKGFIENRAANAKCTGVGKVYGDERQARQTFAKYKKCTQVYCERWQSGSGLDKLAVADR